MAPVRPQDQAADDPADDPAGGDGAVAGGWAVVTLACLGSVLGQAGLFVDLASLPAMARDFQVSDAAAQNTITTYALGYGLAQLVWGPLADRHGRRLVLLAGLGLYAAASLLLATLTSLPAFLLVRLAMGIGAGCGTSVSRAALRDVFSDRCLAQRMSIVGICFAGALGIVPFAGSLVARLGSWRLDFLLLALAALATAWFILRWVKETHSPAPAQRSFGGHPGATLAGYITLLLHPRFLLPAALATLSTAMLACYDAVSPFLLETDLGAGQGRFGQLSLPMSAAYLAGAATVSRRVVAVGQHRLLAAGGLWLVGGSLLMLLLGITAQLSSASLVLPMALVTIGCGLIIPIGLAMPMQAFPTRAGQASALTGFLQQEGSALVVFLATLLPHATQRPLALTLLALALLVALLVGSWRRHASA
ncbi:MFS transporter [Cyanobium sp. NIES-981]|uniref:MFS transporter n=1 Tax=Cyanobium sp. NIES-981 TaxID=1851505 RepID=UPI0015602992|nr:MFS transporter [Cyanobium sp. NIES-981]